MQPLNLFSKPKSKQKKVVSGESVEAKPRTPQNIEPTTVKDEMKALWDGLLSSGKQDVVGGFVKDTGKQFELIIGQEVQINKTQQSQIVEQPAENKPQVSMEHMEYFRSIQNVDRAPETRTEQQVSQAVEQIRMEIKKLIATSRIVERTVKDAGADKAPIKAGRYHLNFFEFVLSVLREATHKLEDTSSMGAVFTSKKQQSKYWNSYKSHGTSFGLSGERSTATQTG